VAQNHEGRKRLWVQLVVGSGEGLDTLGDLAELYPAFNISSLFASTSALL